MIDPFITEVSVGYSSGDVYKTVNNTGTVV